MKTKTILKFGVASMAIASLTLTSCKKKGCTDSTANNYSSEAKKDDGSCTYTAVSYKGNISNIASNVITETYVELASKASTLFDLSTLLNTSQTMVNYDNAKNAWRDTRVPWEKSEGFLFGPVDTKGIDPAIDSWPVNVADLDAVLASSDALTETYIDGLIGELKGFHTIEYLLWGATGNKQIADFTARELEYLLAVTENLKNKTAVLSTSWLPSGENFEGNLTSIGSSSVYTSEKSALEELIEGMIAIADEVGNGKVNDPFSQNDLGLEESQFSHNSKNDFANNMRSISNVYNGSFNIDGLGIYDIIYAKDAALAEQFNTELNIAITSIDNIPGTFSSAVTAQSSAIATVISNISTVQTTLESKIKPIISNL